jgi:glycosyltransferase involved in cell wall biosynthesis
MPAAPRASLLVFADDWGRHPSSCQHLVGRLLDRYDVLWVNTIGTRPPRLDLATLARGAEKLRHWAGPERAPSRCPPGLRVLDPRMWPWFRSPLDRRLNRSLLLRQLAPALESLPTPPVAITTLPLVADLIGELPVARWVYYCVDDFTQWPGLDQAALGFMEGRLVQRADAFLAVSETLRDRLGRMGREARLLTHGVDLDHWAGGVDDPRIPALEGLPRPLVVFWGVVDRRLDVQFVKRLRDDMTDGTILLVGPEQGPDPALRDLAGVALVPPMPYERLPGLAREASVLIMPYADLPVTRAIQPLKLKEYLATGKPAVVSDLPATRPWSDCLDLAASPEAFSAAVLGRLATGTPDIQREARGRLANEDWGEKARQFASWALPMPAGRPDEDREGDLPVTA